MLLLGLPALVVTATATARGNPSSPKPNFLILFADDMGYAQPSFRGGDNSTIYTPHIDKLAQSGATFQNWYSAFHVCSPSRFAMVTGRLPVRGGKVAAVSKFPHLVP